jgi:hypothetical protein
MKLSHRFKVSNLFSKLPGANLLRLVAAVVFVLGGLGTVRADRVTPRTPDRPPRPPSRAAQESDPAAALAGEELPALKAVLLVGPIDGDDGDWTTDEKEHMEQAALELEANGVEVHRFYTPDNDWEAIKAAAEGAHFLFYRGHGVYWSPLPTPTVGGFRLKDQFISSDDIRNDLRLAPNAIVMLYGCFTAGGSGLEGDVIDSAEAQRRVVEYAAPFFEIGAAGYYANWFGDAFQMFVRYLFQGQTLGQAYEAYSDFDAHSVERYAYPPQSELAMWLDKDVWDGVTQYNNTFVGRPDQTLADLFGSTPAEMQLTVPEITLIAEPNTAAATYTVGIESTTDAVFTWTAEMVESEGPWLAAQPLSGASGGRMTVIITPTNQLAGTYQAQIRVAAQDAEIENDTQILPVTLHVLEKAYRVYLPLGRRPD